MHRTELIEWIITILCIILWWPRIFWGYDAQWYHVLIYYVVPIVLLVIFFRRLARVRAGLKYSEETVKHQQTPPGPRA